MAQNVILPYIRTYISTMYVDITKCFFQKFLSKITLTCFRNHKISYAAPIYKFIKTVQFNIRSVPDKSFSGRRDNKLLKKLIDFRS